MKRIITIILSLFVLAIVEANADFRALLVGINYQNADKSIPRLYGCLNDVNDMKSYMSGVLKIPASSIRTLTEEQATRKDILALFRSSIDEMFDKIEMDTDGNQMVTL